MRKNHVISSIFGVLIFAFAAFAQNEGNPENWCRNGAFPGDGTDFKIAEIKTQPNGKVYFYNDYEEVCPNSENCKTKSYVVAKKSGYRRQNFRRLQLRVVSAEKGKRKPSAGF